MKDDGTTKDDLKVKFLKCIFVYIQMMLCDTSYSMLVTLLLFFKKVPEDEVGQSLRAKFEEGSELAVTVVGAMGIEQIISFKESQQK